MTRTIGRLLCSAAVAVAVAVAVALAACDVGGVFIVDNKSDAELVVRVSGSVQEWTSSTLTFRPRQDVLAVPPHARLAVARIPFGDPFQIQKVEVLDARCGLLAAFDVAAGADFARDGYVVAVESNLAIRLVDEFPRDGNPAAAANACPESSAFPSAWLR